MAQHPGKMKDFLTLRPRPRLQLEGSTMRRTIATLGALLATLIVAGPAAAGVVTPVTISVPAVVNHPLASSSAGVYQWSVSNIPAGAPAEFTVGTKLGHCVNYVAPAGGGTAETLRSGNDVDFSGVGNTIPAGSADARVAQIKWLLLSSRARSTSGDLAAAHQLAIWRITNPLNGPTVPETSVYDDPANATSPSLASRLLAEAQAFGLSANNGATIVGGGGAPNCMGTTRAVTVTGAPFTTANVTVGGGGSISGATSLTVNLGPTGTVVLNVLGTTAGAVTVTATVKDSTLVQVDMRATDAIVQQNLANVEYRDVVLTTTITFVDCTPPLPPPTGVLPKVKPPTTVSIAKLTIVKGADRAKVASGGIVHYTITVSNTDKDAAINVRTCDQLPDGMTYVSLGGGDLRRGRDCFTKNSLAPGASVTYKLVARVDLGAKGTFVNHATTVADNAGPRTATATVRAAPATRTNHHRVHGVVG